MSSTMLIEELATRGLAYELLSHEHTERAADEAEALEISPDDVAKTIVLVGDPGRTRVVVPASERIDLRKVRETLGAGKEMRLATEDELAADFPMFELGAVPPFGGPEGDRVVVDPRIAERESVVFEAGSHGQSLRMRSADLLAVTRAETADICHD